MFIESAWCWVVVSVGVILRMKEVLASLEEERIKKNLSEGEKVSSFLVKRIYFLGESIFSAKFFFFYLKKKGNQMGSA